MDVRTAERDEALARPSVVEKFGPVIDIESA
jgi:hypothetical protein